MHDIGRWQPTVHNHEVCPEVLCTRWACFSGRINEALTIVMSDIEFMGMKVNQLKATLSQCVRYAWMTLSVSIGEYLYHAHCQLNIGVQLLPRVHALRVEHRCASAPASSPPVKHTFACHAHRAHSGISRGTMSARTPRSTLSRSLPVATMQRLASPPCMRSSPNHRYARHHFCGMGAHHLDVLSTHGGIA